ncbi:MAG: DUF664 domain-containing protein [Marmoricola sp.]
MDARDLLVDTFGRLREGYVGVPDGLDAEKAHWRPGGTGNSITWLLWHIARVQDDHIAGLAAGTQSWHDGWAERFGFPFEPGDIGYGHTSDEVDAVRVERLEDLVDYHDAVHQQTLAYLDRTDADELDRIIDRNWDPPVTAGVRLVSLIGDCAMHLGQADYVKGLPLTPG